MATTGARPNEIVKLRPIDINCGQQFIFLHVKGNWFKRTPISSSMAELLEEYLTSIPKTSEHLFQNQYEVKTSLGEVDALNGISLKVLFKKQQGLKIISMAP